MFSFPRIDWEAFSAFLITASMLAGFFAWIARLMLARNFVSHHEHLVLGGRIGEVENRLDRVATRDDMARMETRLRLTETSIAVQSAELLSIKEIGQRTEHMVTMLVDHELNREKAP